MRSTASFVQSGATGAPIPLERHRRRCEMKISCDRPQPWELSTRIGSVFSALIPLQTPLHLRRTSSTYSKMANELKDPDFRYTSRVVVGPCTWTVPALTTAGAGPITLTMTTTENGVSTVKTESVTVGVAGFVLHTLRMMDRSKSTCKVQDQTDAAKLEAYAYYQAVLDNLSNELKDAEGKKKRAKPVTIRRAAIRAVGGWFHVPHDRYCFEDACEAAGREAYSDFQFGECTEPC